MEEYIHFINFY